MMPWFSITRDAAAARISIFGEIAAFSTPADELLAQLEGVRHAEVIIDSPGGSSTDALQVHDALAKIETTVTIQHAASAAAILAMAGRPRKIFADARMMIHSPVDFVAGTSKHLRKSADNLDGLNGRLAAIFRTQTGQSAETIANWLSGEKDFYFDATEAVASGLADEIVEPPPLSERQQVIQAADGAADSQTEDEKLFTDFLRVFPTLRVRNRDNFSRELSAWFAGNVRE